MVSETFDFRPWIRPGDLVLWSTVGAEPQSLTVPLMQQAKALGGIRCLLTFGLGDTALEAPPDGVSFISTSGFASNAKLFDQGRLDVIPIHYGEYADLYESGPHKPDVVLLQVGPADANGMHSLGLAVEAMHEAVAGARVVIAEINDQVPQTGGDALIDGRLFHATTQVSRRPREWFGRAPTATDIAIAEHVVRLIPDRATIQYGVGSGPDAIASRLVGKKDLGAHSGSLAESFIDLVDSGTVTNRYKEIDEGVSVTTILYGSKRMFDFAHNNPRLALKRSRYTHGPDVLANFQRLFSINGALEVDLTGQIGSEYANGRYVGAVGGQMQYQRAALRSPGGRAIITLASTFGRDRRSSIVPRLQGPVTTPRSEADVIITEYGMAELRGRTLSERARALIEIAHPDNRAGLRAAAEKLF